MCRDDTTGIEPKGTVKIKKQKMVMLKDCKINYRPIYDLSVINQSWA